MTKEGVFLFYLFWRLRLSGGYRYEGEEFATYVRLLTLYCVDNDSLFTLFPFNQFIGGSNQRAVN